MLRIVIATVVGAIVIFAWGFISHMATPLGEMGLDMLPGDQQILADVQAHVTEPGFYFFPAIVDNPTDEQTAEWTARYESGPRGALIYDPTGDAPMSPKQLGIEFIAGAAAAFILVMIAIPARVNWLTGALLGGAMGLFAWASIDLSYWNWYRFPTLFTEAQLIDQVAGWTITGLVVGIISRWRRSPRSPAPDLSTP